MENKHCDCPCHHNKDKCPQGGFCCPGRIPAEIPNDRFGSPNVCPSTIPTPRYNSPNSSLPIHQLNRLQACIEEINDTLRTIGNPRDPENPEEPQRQRQLQQHFRALRGSLVKVVVTCHDEKVTLLGILEDAGANFILLNTLSEKKLLLFERICLLKHENNDAETFDHEQELLHIDKCLRREITFHFGEIVGRSPELINIFFGIPLHLYMLPFIGCKIEVKTDEEVLISGILCEVDENQFRLEVNEEAEEDGDEEIKIDPCLEEDGVRTINFDEMCFISIGS
ncbi:hypothetical protein CEQ21_03150 [Niallia circulans]|uniref:Uncharacterized protein n=1 Tax=Niallia circulans TaxID=1397 RepID=A0A553SSI7_NIACI|nr:hypothetical protein [Niallia circulans]TRZ39954.1 hypothetical protein CEQ21_03150 [Niallia circulans]